MRAPTTPLAVTSNQPQQLPNLYANGALALLRPDSCPFTNRQLNLIFFAILELADVFNLSLQWHIAITNPLRTLSSPLLLHLCFQIVSSTSGLSCTSLSSYGCCKISKSEMEKGNLTHSSNSN